MNKVQTQNKKIQDEKFPLVEGELEAIIVNGDAEKLVILAEKIGRELVKYKLTTSQVRNFFGIARQIESEIDQEKRKPQGTKELPRELPDKAYRQLMLLKPKLAYQSRRSKEQQKSEGVEKLSEVLIPAIDLVGKDIERFKNFIDFFEAILAYHNANGGRESSGRGGF